MDDYINREVALRKCGWYNTINNKSICAIRKDKLVSIPAANVVEVVRCKDCRYRMPELYAWAHKVVDKWCSRLDIYGIDDNHFCSYGERNEEVI